MPVNVAAFRLYLSLTATEGRGWLDTILCFLPDTSVAVPSTLNRMSSRSAFGVLIGYKIVANEADTKAKINVIIVKSFFIVHVFFGFVQK